MSIENWPAMPEPIRRDGPYRMYKGGRYTVYDDGHSAETPYQTDRAEALEARLRTADALLAATKNCTCRPYEGGKTIVVEIDGDVWASIWTYLAAREKER